MITRLKILPKTMGIKKEVIIPDMKGVVTPYNLCRRHTSSWMEEENQIERGEKKGEYKSNGMEKRKIR